MRELIDEVLFLSELESGGRVVSLGAGAGAPRARHRRGRARGARLPGRRVALAVEGDERDRRSRCDRECSAWSRQNLAENAIRYAGPGATFTLAVEREGDAIVLRGHGRRRRRQRGGALAAVRALLPRRPRARLARHGPRARDRQAHRRPGGRHRRGAAAAREPGSRSAARFPSAADPEAPSRAGGGPVKCRLGAASRSVNSPTCARPDPLALIQIATARSPFVAPADDRRAGDSL